MIDRPMRSSRWVMGAALALGLVSGRARAASIHLSGSVYVDYWRITNSKVAAQSPSGLTPEGSLKVSADVNEDLGFSAKACFSCHGMELEHLMLDWTPKAAFNVQAGRVAVPFGEYANRVDPSGHATASAPLIYDMGRMAYGGRSAFNLGVVPQPYVDTGVVLYGQTWLGQLLQIWYGGYGVVGMRGGNDIDFSAMRTLYYTDNNRLPSGGGRVALTFAQGDPDSFLGDVSLGGSYTGGRYDKDGTLSYQAWGADASFKLWAVTLRGEYAARRTDFDTRAAGYTYTIVDPWFDKSGWYGELEHPIGKRITAVYRVDQLRRRGVPLPGSSPSLSLDSRITRYTAGLMITPVSALFIKAAYEYWQPNDFPDLHTFHVGIGGAF